MIRPKQLWYLPVLAAAVGMMMLRLLAMAQVLELAEFGRYSAGLLVSTTFCMLGCAGLQSLLQRDMPIMAARGRLLRPLVLTMQALLVACACAAFLLAVPAAGGELAGLKAGVLAVAILHGLSQQVFLVVTVESRSLGEPVRYAAQNLWRALAVVAAGAAAAMSTGSATWTLACEAAVTLVVSFAIVREIARRFGTRLGALAGLAQRRWRQVDWSAASVFLAISVVSSVAATVDRWFAASLLDVAEFALYAFAGIVLLVAQSAQAMINAAVFPALARRHALQGSRAAFASSARVSLALAAAGVVLCVPAYFLIDSAVQRWYPAYAGGLAILPLVLAAGVVRLSDFWSSFLMICGHERRLLALHLGAGFGVCAAWALALLSRPAPAPALADFAWLALALALSVHAGAALVALRVSRPGLPRVRMEEAP